MKLKFHQGKSLTSQEYIHAEVLLSVHLTGAIDLPSCHGFWRIMFYQDDQNEGVSEKKDEVSFYSQKWRQHYVWRAACFTYVSKSINHQRVNKISASRSQVGWL